VGKALSCPRHAGTDAAGQSFHRSYISPIGPIPQALTPQVPALRLGLWKRVFIFQVVGGEPAAREADCAPVIDPFMLM